MVALLTVKELFLCLSECFALCVELNGHCSHCIHHDLPILLLELSRISPCHSNSFNISLTSPQSRSDGVHDPLYLLVLSFDTLRVKVYAKTGRVEVLKEMEILLQLVDVTSN
jgi:hypothetical protein